MAESDVKLLEEARKRFKRAVEAEDENRRLRKQDMEFHAGNSDNHYQWSDDAKRSRMPNGKLARPMLTVNKLPQHTRQVTNEQRQNRPAIKVRAVDDKGDIKVADVLNGIVRHVESNKNEKYSGAAVAYTTACEHQVISGLGYFAIATDYCDSDSFDQDIFFRRIRNPFTIYDDPDIQTPDGRDRKWLFETDLITEEEYQARFPDADQIEWSALGAEEFAHWFNVTEKKLRIANYWRVEETAQWLSLMPDGQIVKDSKKAEGAQQSRRVMDRKVVCYTLNGAEVLETTEWAGRFIPFCRVVGNEFDIDGKVEISGLVRNAKGAQMMYNWWVTNEAEFLGSSTKAPYIAAMEALQGFEEEWRTSNTQNHAVLHFNAFDEDGNPVPVPQRVAPVLPAAGFIQAKMGAADDIKSTTGQYDASLGQKSNETSGRAIANRQRESDTANFHYIDNLGFAIEFAGQIIVDLVPKIYDTERVVRIIGEDGTEDYAQIDPSMQVAVDKVLGRDGTEQERYNLGVGKYDVVVSVGPSYATKRQESAELAVQLSQANPAFAAATMDLMPKMLDMPYADEFQKRARAMLPPQVQQAIGDEQGNEPLPPQAMAAIEQAKQMLGQAHGQIEALQQGLQEKESELQQAKAQAGEVDQMLAAAKTEGEQIKLEALRVEKAAEVQIAGMRVEEARLKLALAEQTAQHQVRMAGHEAGVAAAEKEAEMSEPEEGAEVEESAGHEQQEMSVLESLVGALQDIQARIANMEQQSASRPRSMRVRTPSGRLIEAAMGDDGTVSMNQVA